MFPLKRERHLEEFFINRSARTVLTFFKSYTEKSGRPATRSTLPGVRSASRLSLFQNALHAARSF
jgi:hypothetical protein